MKRFTVVGQKKAFLAKEGLCKTISPTEGGLRCFAADALWETRQLDRGLQTGILIHEFILVLEPLFQQCLSGELEARQGRSGREVALTLTERLGPFHLFLATFSNSSSSTHEYNWSPVGSSGGVWGTRGTEDLEVVDVRHDHDDHLIS